MRQRRRKNKRRGSIGVQTIVVLLAVLIGILGAFQFWADPFPGLVLGIVAAFAGAYVTRDATQD